MKTKKLLMLFILSLCIIAACGKQNTSSENNNGNVTSESTQTPPPEKAVDKLNTTEKLIYDQLTARVSINPIKIIDVGEFYNSFVSSGAGNNVIVLKFSDDCFANQPKDCYYCLLVEKGDITDGDKKISSETRKKWADADKRQKDYINALVEEEDPVVTMVELGSDYSPKRHETKGLNIDKINDALAEYWDENH